MDVNLLKSFQIPVSGKHSQHMKSTINASLIAFSASLKTEVNLKDFGLLDEKVIHILLIFDSVLKVPLNQL